MLRSLHLKDVGPAPELKFEFAPRLNLLTGDNGLGKTFVLDVIWAVLTTTWAGERAFPARPRSTNGGQQKPAIIRSILESRDGPNTNLLPETTSTYDRRSQTWESTWHIGMKTAGFKPREDQTDPAQIRPLSLVVYARTDGGVHIWDSYQVPPSLKEYARAAVNLSPRELWDGKEIEDRETGTKRVVCEGLIKDWVRWQGGKSKTFEYLCRVLSDLSPPGEELVPDAPTRVLLDDRRDIPTLALPYGIVPVTLASAGMRRIMGLAYALVWAWVEHQRAAELIGLPPTQDMVLLLDEVEAHLHPKWQREILPALLKAINSIAPHVTVQMIVSTHAPLVMASVEAIFDEEADDLFHFQLDGSVIKVEELSFAKQGDAGNWLVSESFGLRLPRSIESQCAIDAALAFMGGDRPEAERQIASIDPAPPARESLQKRIHRLLMLHVPGHDDFWPTWIVTSGKTPTKRKRS